MPGPKPEDQRVSRRVVVLFTETEYEDLAYLARMSRVSLSTYIRSSMKEKTDVYIAGR